MFDIAGKKKWEAWTKKIDAGVTKEEAQKQYVAKFNELSSKLGIN
jgi:acyl-CoA-binding protein